MTSFGGIDLTRFDAAVAAAAAANDDAEGAIEEAS
eukprot:CAMPEP_0119490348 /NCGR_PEP_ID=MMETSP1344-20130328/15541_1 /TAXON_ID=236787 /ORGANISM="Florenciella parvula, Strain CCMP2471" /LENGTH=34 /DNA_ID= /DNA_START= /DNA_END= /DNA_ORIENTATION=